MIFEIICRRLHWQPDGCFQAKQLNGGGELYLEKYPKLKVKIVDGSSLASAIVLNNIPKGTEEVFLCGQLSKVACAAACTLGKNGVKVSEPNLMLKELQPTVSCNIL